MAVSKHRLRRGRTTLTLRPGVHRRVPMFPIEVIGVFVALAAVALLSAVSDVVNEPQDPAVVTAGVDANTCGTPAELYVRTVGADR